MTVRKLKLPSTRRGRSLLVAASAAFLVMFAFNANDAASRVPDNRARCQSLPASPSAGVANFFDRFDDPQETMAWCLRSENKALRDGKRAAVGKAFLGTIVELALLAGLIVIGRRVIRWINAGDRG